MPVELRAAGRRVFRLARQVGEGGLCLDRPAPFDVGRPVKVRFFLPDAEAALTLQAELEITSDAREDNGERGACGLRFLEPPRDARDAIVAYVAERLGLPPARRI